MEEFRVLVCGGRDYGNRKFVYETLDCLLLCIPNLVIVQGDASGADRLAKDWAISRGVKHMDYPADWKNLGNAAGPIRNSHMLKDSKPKMTVAFTGGKGTDDMIDKSLSARLPVVRPCLKYTVRMKGFK